MRVPPLFHQPSSSSQSPSFSSLPDEIIVNFLARISKSQYRSLCSVSKSFYSLLSSPEIYAARSQIGSTEPRLYVCLRLPEETKHQSWFFLGEIESELSLVPVKLSSSYFRARLYSTSVSVGSEIYQIGGTIDEKRSRAVFVIDGRSHTWRRGPNLTVARKNAKSWFLEGKIYVIGGCRKTEEPMNWGEVFDIKTQTWKPLPSPSDDGLDPNHKVLVFGGRLYVFTKGNYAYDPELGRWVVVTEVGFVGLEPANITGPWCVIGDVMFAEYDRMYKWYNPRYRKWLKVYGLHDVYVKRAYKYSSVQLVNHGGKLVIIWHEWAALRTENKRIWCAVIRLEERSTLVGPQIWGEVERCNLVVLTVHKSYKLLTCQSVSV